jgi:histidinol-phosphatase (PHP family)
VIDVHLHTGRCRHASGTPSEYAAVAESRGITTIAFTDHMPLLDNDDSDYAMSSSELPEYVDDVCRTAREARVEVLLGIEADWVPGREADIAEALALHRYDLVLGSVHFIDGWAFDDPRCRHGYEAWDAEALWNRYFDELVTAASSGLFDVMAHPDLLKKFDYRPPQDLSPLYARAAEAFAEAEVAVEVNTAGLRKPCREIYPALGLLAACRRAGVPATLGSDAHDPTDVGAGYGEARELLQAAGYDSLVVFRGREPEEVPL